jgi:ubiquinone/menaquinone biosynthesis C-methylase UbiE
VTSRLPAALADELDRDPRWMYSWELGPRRTPTHSPVLESIHATRASLIEGPVREALAAAGPGARALDLACCEGWFSHRLMDWGAGEVVGVDMREQSIRRAELVSDFLGYDSERLTFRTADVHSLSAEELGSFDVVLCLGLIYHLEDPMGALRLARSLTRGLCVVESQTARAETPVLFGFSSRLAFEATDAVLAVHLEPDQATNQLASAGGSLSFCPNPAALWLMVSTAGFGHVVRAEPGPEHDPDFHTGDRTVLLARPG